LAWAATNMIAQVVFDLPLDGPFDYLIPPPLVEKIAVGMRVRVSFGPRPQTGFVVAVLEQSTIEKLKPIQALRDVASVFTPLDLSFARRFSAYYGCSLGEALGTLFRSQGTAQISLSRVHQPALSLYRCSVGRYAEKIRKIIDGYRSLSSMQQHRFLILVPDIFRAQMLAPLLNIEGVVKIGMRSSVFECDGRLACVIMVDDEDPSYKQEQTPMYDTRQVLLMRAKTYGFDIAFVGTSPSVELMAMTRTAKVKFIDVKDAHAPAVTAVDLSNYKYMPGLVSPALSEALQAVLKAGGKSILVLNRRGSYRITRCVDCAYVLKCSRCDSSLIYSKSAGKYLCRHCTYTAPGNVVCPKCHKPSWHSQGVGVEQVQTELKKYFSGARIVSFERATKLSAKEKTRPLLPDFDILISTQAVLRFQGIWQVAMAAFIDFDAELNRLDMRSSSNAFSLGRHISDMTLERVFIQTRNIDHYVIKSLKSNDSQKFYDEELKMRKELGFCPFKHWIKITLRAKSEEFAQETAGQVYNQLSQMVPENCSVMPPLADTMTRKRDQFLFSVMVQADQVTSTMALIRAALGQVKRRSRGLFALNVDP